MKTVIFYTFSDEYELGHETARPTLAEAKARAKTAAEDDGATVAVWKHKAAGSDMRRLACALFNRDSFQLDVELVGRWVVDEEWDEDTESHVSTEPRWERG